MRALKKLRSGCPIATALDIFGDRWTLVIMRDLAMGKTRFGDFSQSPERIPTNVLTDRLLRLEEFGLIEKSPYQEHPIRYDYAVTQKGAELLPVLQAVCKWANKHLPGTWKTPDKFLSLKPSDLTVRKAKTGE
ncbi:helix-turn-helix transcriptional regulator [Methylocystis sp. L43]|jgi:DNA-binding HxlR family transcriptional regulator|uniref:winged helix-turn-helix transcriptional regulator n=1 Tax=unclassified Methylocystis TaxID=2625913 RepID=UPI0018C2B9AA|nr:MULTISPECIES: helix-turn-helix domain-containing protein [unclassified Methylocystis]MBG0798830.1 helix-turn-helix transcriptional regulator [Methylocystis sp. L43]MBG0806337.1 helix-turn-helix transcriptional regulator [Methylocystis sp. H15]